MSRLHAFTAIVVIGAVAAACSDQVTRKAKPRTSAPAEPWVEGEGDGDYEAWPPDTDLDMTDGGTISPPKPLDGGLGVSTGPAVETIVAYSSPLPVGIDHRAGVEAAFDAQHAMSGYIHNALEAPLRGTLGVSDIAWRVGLGSDPSSFVALGRWRDGQSSPSFYGAAIELSQTQGFHYVAGSLARALPASGDETYAPVSGGASGTSAVSTPTSDDGSLVGAVTASPKATVRFGASTRIAIAFGVNGGGVALTVATTGGQSNPSLSEVATYTSAKSEHVFGGVVPVSGSGCEGPCTALVRGFFTGPKGESLSLVFVIQSGSPKAVRGAMTLGR